MATHRTPTGLGSGLLVLAMLHWAPVQAQQYTLTDLGSLGGFSQASGVNRAGQVVGLASIPGATSHAFLYSNGTLQDLGTLGGPNSGASGINNAGQVVGSADLPGVPVPGGGINVDSHATAWNGTTPRDLGTLGGANSGAIGINDAGQVVGVADTTGNATFRATMWNGTTPRDLGTLGGTYSGAAGINDAGQVVGFASIPGDGTRHAFLYSNGTMQDLGTLGGNYSQAWGINNAGQVVGYAGTPGNVPGSNGDLHATLWDGTTVTDLGTLGGSSSQALGINDAGQVVGVAEITGNAAQHATLWKNGKPIDLNAKLTGPLAHYVTLTDAVGINDRGWIAANGTDSRTGQYHAYLLKPTCRERDEDHEREEGHEEEPGEDQRAKKSKKCEPDRDIGDDGIGGR